MSDEQEEPQKKPSQRVTYKLTAVFEHDDFKKQSFNFAGSFRPAGESQVYERSVKVGPSPIALTAVIPPGFVEQPGLIIVQVAASTTEQPAEVRLVRLGEPDGLVCGEDFPLSIQLQDFSKWSLVAARPNTIVTLMVASK
jgi:hypothetical protein